MENVTIEDLKEPLELRGGALVAETRARRVLARALRLLFLRPGELLHRPDYGADLGSYRNRPATPAAIQEIENAITRGLALMQEIESWEVEIRREEYLLMTLTIQVSGERLTVRDVRI